MDDQKLCISCSQFLNWVPAGVSKKTGKPYNGFWACPEKHPQKKPAYQNPNPPSAKAFTQSLEADFDRQRNIIRQHSQDMAIKALELMHKVDPEGLMQELEQAALTAQTNILNAVILQVKKLSDHFDKDVSGK